MSNFKKNSIYVFVDYLSTIISFFLTYRIFSLKLGINFIGIWSLVFSFFSIGGIGNSGLSGAIVKIISQLKARNEVIKIKTTFETIYFSVIIVSIFFSLLFIFLFFNFSFVPNKNIELIQPIFIYLVVGFLFNSISQVFLNYFDSLNFSYLKSQINIFVKLFYVVCTYYFVNKSGVLGAGQAYFLYITVQLMLSMVVFKRIEKNINILFPKFSKKTFKEVYSYGINFQITSIAMILVEPTTKYLISRYGGTFVLGIFELAYKTIIHLRTIVVNVFNLLIPIVTNKTEINSNFYNKFYLKINKLSQTLFAIIFNLILVNLSLASLIWFGKIEVEFIYIGIIVCTNIIINLVSLPAYVFNIASSNIRINSFSFVLASVVNLILGLIMGWTWGGYGVILAWLICGITAATYIQLKFNLVNSISYTNIIGFKHIVTFICSIVLTLGSIFFRNSQIEYFFISNLFFLILIYIIFKNDLLFKLAIKLLKQKTK